MAIVHWEPVRELGAIQSEMNRLFNSFFDPQTPSGATGPARRWIPAMDLVEREGEYVLRADLPGMTESDVNIEFEKNVLTVSGQRKAEQERSGEGYYRIERSFGAFSRSLTLPDGVDPKAIGASFHNGVLEVTIPKPEARKPHRVAIAIGAEEPAAVESTARDTGTPETPATAAAEETPMAVAAGNGHAA